MGSTETKATRDNGKLRYGLMGGVWFCFQGWREKKGTKQERS